MQPYNNHTVHTPIGLIEMLKLYGCNPVFVLVSGSDASKEYSEKDIL